MPIRSIRLLAAVVLLGAGSSVSSIGDSIPPAVQGGRGISAAEQVRAREAPGPALTAQKLPTNVAAGPQKTGQGRLFRLKMVRAVDEHGFERPIVAYSMLVPVDWESEGLVTWNVRPFDRCHMVQIALRASGPDGLGIEVFPDDNWVWDDDPALRLQANQLDALSGIRPCEVSPPLSAAEYIRRRLGQIRPNARLVAVEPASEIQQRLERRTQETEQSAARYEVRLSIRPDAARARLQYELAGRPMEEWIYAFTLTAVRPGIGMNRQTLQLMQKNSYSCLAHMTAHRAPAGQPDASEKLFDLLWSTSRINPEWEARVNQVVLAIKRIELRGVRDRSRIMAEAAKEIAEMQAQGWQNRQRAEDRMFEGISASIRGVETYRNPATGETISLSSGYARAWVNNRGEYLVSDSPGLDPNVELKEEWKPLERVGK